MGVSDKVYIARIYLAHAFGAQTIYHESLFQSYNAAYRYLLSISKETNERFLGEIIALVMGDEEPWESE